MNLHFCVSVVFILFGTFAASEGDCQVGECSKTAVHESYTLFPTVDACYADEAMANATCTDIPAEVVPIECLAGTWSEDLTASCVLCGTFDIENGEGPDAVASASNTMVSCNEGFTFGDDGNTTTITCQDTGEWNKKPTCSAVICGTFEIENGKGPTAVFYPSNTTTVECDEGFTIGDDGNTTTITCQDTGKWDKQPTCSAGNILFGALYLVTVSLAMGLVTSNM